MVCQKYAMIFLTDMNTIANKILARAKRHGAGGGCFLPST